MKAYMEKYPIRLNVRMQENLRDDAQKLAQRMGISTSALFRIAMQQFRPKFGTIFKYCTLFEWIDI